MGVDGPESDRTVRKVIVKAKKVIVSCGALWSPILLLQSGLKVREYGLVSECFAELDRTDISAEISIFIPSTL